MAKEKTKWVCTTCGSAQGKWGGQCSACGEWNTLIEEVERGAEGNRFHSFETKRALPQRIDEVDIKSVSRHQTGFIDFDRLMGGGIVEGALTLIGGNPGIGKSTLLLQLAAQFAKAEKKVLYVCGEESVEQTSLRAKRIGAGGDNLYLLSETLFEEIERHIDRLKPDLLIVDSIQIVYRAEVPSLPGSVTQVREIAMRCMHLAKGMKMATFVIGHVTKSGEIAGPRILEHIVDTVLDFEGDKEHGYRVLRSRKNRFGPTEEVALFQMGEKGLFPVDNPSELFLQQRNTQGVGSVIIPTLEGSRAILVEVQALVTPSPFPSPSRRSAGIDGNRLALLLAVLEKKMGYRFHNLDVFVSIAGGMQIREPAIDLGILLAIASSYCNRSIDAHTIVMGEVGLAGEVRSVPRVESRLKEALHMGFTRGVLPVRNTHRLKAPRVKGKSLSLGGVQTIEEAIDLLLESYPSKKPLVKS